MMGFRRMFAGHWILMAGLLFLIHTLFENGEWGGLIIAVIALLVLW